MTPEEQADAEREPQPKDMKLEDLLALFRRDLPRPDELVTRRQLVDLYGVLAAHQQMLLSVLSLVLLERPNLAFKDASVDAQRSLNVAADEFVRAIDRLAKEPEGGA